MALPTQQSGSTDIKKVMISSTAMDLPEHRDLVKDACLRQGMFPVMMEHLPASSADAIQASMKMVNEVDAYLGVFRSLCLSLWFYSRRSQHLYH